MFFKIIFLLIILFLFIIKKNNVEPFISCIKKYYNHDVVIHMKDNINKYSGTLIKSDDNFIYLMLDGVILSPIDKNNIKKIEFNNCPNENIYFEYLGEETKIVYPCDNELADMLMKTDYENSNWNSDYYNSPDSYCLSKQNYHCNNSSYLLNQNQIQTHHSLML